MIYSVTHPLSQQNNYLDLLREFRQRIIKTVCMHCETELGSKLLHPDNKLMAQPQEVRISHGICEDCNKEEKQ